MSVWRNPDMGHKQPSEFGYTTSTNPERFVAVIEHAKNLISALESSSSSTESKVAGARTFLVWRSTTRSLLLRFGSHRQSAFHLRSDSPRPPVLCSGLVETWSCCSLTVFAMPATFGSMKCVTRLTSMSRRSSQATSRSMSVAGSIGGPSRGQDRGTRRRIDLVVPSGKDSGNVGNLHHSRGSDVRRSCRLTCTY